MAAFIFLFIFTSIIFHYKSSPTNGQGLPCRPGFPSTNFPFLPNNQQHENYTHSMWNLACKNDITTIHFPSYGDLIVKTISYDTKRLNFIDPKNCVHGVFLKLDLTSTPFSYFYATKNHTYLNCSTSLSPFSEIPCLSSSTYHVYTVDPSMKVPGSCSKVKTVAIPFAYNAFISDNSFGLGLTWELPGCEACNAKSKQDVLMPDAERQPIKCFHITLHKAIISIFCFILITLIAMRLCQLKKFHDKKGKPSGTEKLLGQYITMNLTRNKNAGSNDKVLSNQIDSFNTVVKVPNEEVYFPN